MLSASLWRRVLGVEKTVIEGVDFDDEQEAVTVRVWPTRGAASRCGKCQRRSPGFDAGAGRRKWRSLDSGTVQVFIEADAPRVRCRDHGVVVAHVPWARHGAGHTRAFDDMAAWLAVHCSKSAVTELMRIAWRTTGAIVERVAEGLAAGRDPLDGLRRIGVDEVSYKRQHKYLTVVIDHDTGALVWAAKGHSKEILGRFFDDLGPGRTAQLELISADQAPWIALTIAERAPAAVRCADPFHVVAWVTKALNQTRNETLRDAIAAARKEPPAPRGHPCAGVVSRPLRDHVKQLRGNRLPLLKNPESLTDDQRIKLTMIANTDPRLFHAYTLKEEIRLIFKLTSETAPAELDAWIIRARESGLDHFVKLSASIERERASILASIEHGLSNALIESTNTKIRLLTRIAYGFKNAEALIALAMLSLGKYRPQIPGRQPTHQS